MFVMISSNRTLLLGVVFFAAGFLVHALPSLDTFRRQEITPLSPAQIDAFTPYTWYASAGQCPASQTINWDCGMPCEANPDFKPVASGGDGNATQYWLVGYDPSLETVIVAHEGTNFSNIEPIRTDLKIQLLPLNESLFPGLSPDILVHKGFQNEQALTALDIQAAVQRTIDTYNTTQVTLVGHSLGAALSLIDSVYLPLHIPQVSYTFIGYGLPRVGNQAFADYVGAQSISVTHINNRKDPVPILPSMFLGYVHPSGEVHIEDSSEWASCPGQDNSSTQCVVGDVSILDANASDHSGPYNGITMGC